MSRRARVTRFFLWISVIGWGIGLGAKLFDIFVLASAYSAAPPASLEFLPYGPHFPHDPGEFFQPLSALIVPGVLGAAIAGRKTPFSYRVLLLISATMFIIIWILTPTIFWPMIRELYGAHTGRLPQTTPEIIALLHRWLVWDWFRTALIAVGFVASIRALSVPYPEAEARHTAAS